MGARESASFCGLGGCYNIMTFHCNGSASRILSTRPAPRSAIPSGRAPSTSSWTPAPGSSSASRVA